MMLAVHRNSPGMKKSQLDRLTPAQMAGKQVKVTKNTKNTDRSCLHDWNDTRKNYTSEGFHFNTASAIFRVCIDISIFSKGFRGRKTLKFQGYPGFKQCIIQVQYLHI